MSNNTGDTNLTEMGEFFPTAARKPAQPTRLMVVPLQPGQSLEDAVRLREERTARIRKQIAEQSRGAA